MLGDIFIDNLPIIDLHGYDREIAVVKTNDFILENIILNNKKIVILHGKGEGILKKAIHDNLNKNKTIKKFYVAPFNPGCTIIELN